MTDEVLWKDRTYDGPLYYFVYVPSKGGRAYRGLNQELREYCDVLVVGVPIHMHITARLSGYNTPKISSSRRDKNVKFRMIIAENVGLGTGNYVDLYRKASLDAAAYNVLTQKELENAKAE